MLTGDSAGGSLATSLTFWLIENEEKKPDLLLLCYALLNTNLKVF